MTRLWIWCSVTAILGGGVVLGALGQAPASGPTPAPRPVPAAVPATTRLDAGDLQVRLGCATCHGAQGRSPLSNIPVLAGQRPEWLEARLKAFRRQGARNGSGIMPRYAANLKDAQITALARMYAADPPPPATRPPADSDLGAGQTLYVRGRPRDRVIACGTCHTDAGTGTTTPLIPALRGQHAGYVTYRLNGYRALPITTADGQAGPQAMRTVARSLSDADIRAVAAYVEAMPARSLP